MKPHERLRQVRNILGETQDKIGRGIGVSRSAINQLETGRNNISDQVLLLLRYVWKVNPDYIMHGTGEPFLKRSATVDPPDSPPPETKEYEALQQRNKELEDELMRYKRIVDKLTGI
jgi:transcriptional regulator with XRE-family HTH domain